MEEPPRKKRKTAKTAESLQANGDQERQLDALVQQKGKPKPKKSVEPQENASEELDEASQMRRAFRQIFDGMVGAQVEVMTRPIVLSDINDVDISEIPPAVLNAGIKKLNDWISRQEETTFGENQKADVVLLLSYAAEKTGMTLEDLAPHQRRQTASSAADIQQQDQVSALRKRIFNLKRQVERQTLLARELDDLNFRCSRLHSINDDSSETQKLLADPGAVLQRNMAAIGPLYRWIRDNKGALKDALQRGREKRREELAEGIPSVGFEIPDLHQFILSQLQELSRPNQPEKEEPEQEPSPPATAPEPEVEPTPEPEPELEPERARGGRRKRRGT